MHAAVRYIDLVHGNLSHAFDENTKFDMCLLTLDQHEITHFSQALPSLLACSKKGGKIVILFPNLSLNLSLVHAQEFMRHIGSMQGSSSIYYSGSPASTGIVKKLAALRSASRSRLVSFARYFAYLAMLTPYIYSMNKREELISADLHAAIPDPYLSITVEIEC